MKEVHKIAKNQQWFLKIVKQAPAKVKEKKENLEKQLDENKIDKAYFSQILDYITQQASVVGPTPQEKHQLFEEFNAGKNEDFIIKEEYQKFQQRISLMLQATQNN